MAKEFIINTSRVNSYGSRVITSGIITEHFLNNPILLYMHRRGWEGKTPIGKVENLRVDGDKLIGTPVFDMEDEEAAKIARKWEQGFLNMCSAGLEPVEFSTDAALIHPGQSRATVTKSKLVEVSIVDIGANEDCIKLYSPSDGQLLTLSTGEPSAIVPLLSAKPTPEPQAGDNNNKIEFSMNKILLILGLADTATESDAVQAIEKLKVSAQRAETIELARIESAVDTAIKAKRTTADKREHFIALGKSAGYESLVATLDMLTPAQKPTDWLSHAAGGTTPPTEGKKFSEIPEQQLEEMRQTNQPEYIKLFKAEFGFVPEIK